MVLFSLGVFLIVVLMTFLLGGEMSMYFNIPSLLIVVPPALIFARAATSKASFSQAFAYALDTNQTISVRELKQAGKVFSVMGNTAMWMGWFGVISGAVAMASHIKSEDFAEVIGPATAVCLLTLLYGVIIKVLCYLFQQKLCFAAEFFESSELAAITVKIPEVPSCT